MNKYILFILLYSFIYPRRDCLENENQRSIACAGRIDTDSVYYSLDSLFCIHFNTQGDVDLDLTDLNENNIPDYIEEVGIIADSAYHVLVHELGFNNAPSDDDGIYDIFLKDYSKGTFGHCCKDNPSQNSNSQTSYLQIDSNYSGNDGKYVESDLEYMRLTLVHEFFHAIQYGYRSNYHTESYFYEMSSMWIEDVIVPDGDDYLDWPLDTFLNNPTAIFDHTGPGYELALFGHYLSSFVDSNGYINIKNSTIMREIWERFGSNNSSALSAFKYVLNGQNYTFTFIEAWVDFISRNLYNGLYDDMDNPFYYYIDQKLIDPIQTNPEALEDSISIELNLDNNSVFLQSYKIEDLTTSILDIKHDDDNYIGKIAFIKSNIYYNNSFYWSQNNITNQLFTDDVMHLVYATESPNNDLIITIIQYNVPIPPSDLTVIAAQDSIILYWNPSPGPGDNLDYVIYRNGDSLDVTSDTIYVDSNAIVDLTTYIYVTTCVNAIGESQPSNSVTINSWPSVENVTETQILSIYPNPIIETLDANILYTLDRDYTHTSVELINIRGQIINKVSLQYYERGLHREKINNLISPELVAGIYFIRLHLNDNLFWSKKITIIP